ncbi:MFS transporter, partial [Streptomyces sp. SID8455]|nr:MFS transporter [Streptomyces sp. SID8455]
TGYGLVYLGLGIASPNANDLLHRRVDASGRATALSIQSLALQLVAAGAGLAAGTLPPGPLPWLLAAAVVLAGALCWVRRAAPAKPYSEDAADLGQAPVDARFGRIDV